MIRTRSQYPSTPATVVTATCEGVLNVTEFDCVNACVLSWNPVAVGAAGVEVPSTTHALPFHISHDSLKSADGLVGGGVGSGFGGFVMNGLMMTMSSVTSAPGAEKASSARR